MNETLQPDKIFLIRRYFDGYRVAWAVIGFATLLKISAVLCCIGIWIAGAVLADQYALTKSAQQLCIGGGIVLGAFVFAALLILGSLVSALGEILRAHLDTAVYVCPFLTDAERMQAAELKAVNHPASSGSAPPLKWRQRFTGRWCG